MAKEQKKEAPVKEEVNVAEALVNNNMLGDKAITDALAEIEKEKDEKKKSEAKEAICIATYHNAKTRLELRARRREDDITKEKLEASKVLLERLLGVKTEIKDGSLVPTKEKIDVKDRLTPVQYREEKNKLNAEIEKKSQESVKLRDREIKELQNSYEGRWRYSYYWD